MNILAQHGSFSLSDFQEENKLGFTLFQSEGIAGTSFVDLPQSDKKIPVLKIEFVRNEGGLRKFLSAQKLLSHDEREQNYQNFQVMKATQNKAWRNRLKPRDVAQILAQPNHQIEWAATEGAYQNPTLYIRTRDFQDNFPVVLKKLFVAGLFEAKTFYAFSFQLDYAGPAPTRQAFAEIYEEMSYFFKTAQRHERKTHLTPNPS